MMTEKPVLVLLHGWGSTAGIWQPVAEQLWDSYECYLPELPGHGDSRFTETRLELLAREILDSIGRPAIWVGWSLGALIAMQAALLMPRQVQQLLIVSGTPAFVRHEGWDTAMPVDTFDQFQTGFAGHASKTLKRFIALQAHGDSQSKTVVRQLADSSADRPDAIGWGLEVLRDGDLLAGLSSISCPVNCLYGESDALVPVAVKDGMRERVNSKVTVWPDTGHAPFLSRPDVFVDWLREVAHG